MPYRGSRLHAIHRRSNGEVSLRPFVTEWRAHATTTTTCMSGSLSDNIESKHVIIVQKPPHNTHHDLRLISDFLRVMCPHTVSTLLSVAHLGVGT